MCFRSARLLVSLPSHLLLFSIEYFFCYWYLSEYLPVKSLHKFLEQLFAKIIDSTVSLSRPDSRSAPPLFESLAKIYTTALALVTGSSFVTLPPKIARTLPICSCDEKWRKLGISEFQGGENGCSGQWDNLPVKLGFDKPILLRCPTPIPREENVLQGLKS